MINIGKVVARGKLDRKPNRSLVLAAPSRETDSTDKCIQNVEQNHVRRKNGTVRQVLPRYAAATKIVYYYIRMLLSVDQITHSFFLDPSQLIFWFFSTADSGSYLVKCHPPWWYDPTTLSRHHTSTQKIGFVAIKSKHAHQPVVLTYPAQPVMLIYLATVRVCFWPLCSKERQCPMPVTLPCRTTAKRLSIVRVHHMSSWLEPHMMHSSIQDEQC